MEKQSIFVNLALGAVVTLLPFTGAAQTGSMSNSSGSQGGSGSSMSSGSQGGSMSSSTHESKTNLSLTDKKFVRDAAQGGLAEVELGKLASEKASSDDVKKFGQRMVDDHSKANDKLKEVASSEGVQLPQGLSAKDKATKARLSKLSGEQFDKAYMSDMVKDHTQDVAEFQHESRSGKEPAVKDFASQTLPTLEDHLKQAKEIAPKTQSASNMHGQQSR
jgi:putative membrane protein